MDINHVQQSAFQRQVNPARGTDQRHREQDQNMQAKMRQAEARERAQDQQRQQQQQEWMRPERRLDGRLVRIGSSQQEVGDPDQARSNLMRQKIARTYSSTSQSSDSQDYQTDSQAEQASQNQQTARSVVRDNIDFVV